MAEGTVSEGFQDDEVIHYQAVVTQLGGGAAASLAQRSAGTGRGTRGQQRGSLMAGARLPREAGCEERQTWLLAAGGKGAVSEAL